MLQFSVDA